MKRAMTKYPAVSRQMVSGMTAFERGQFDFMGARRECPFRDDMKAEQWRDGWLTERAQKVRA